MQHRVLTRLSACVLSAGLAAAWGAAEDGEGMTVAVVGGGLTGAASAAYLRDAYPGASILVFEREPEVGGALRTAPYLPNVSVDVGAAAWHSGHTLMNELCAKAGVLTEDPHAARGLNTAAYGVWNGKEVVFKKSSGSYSMVASMLWRYGWSPVHSQTLVAGTHERFRGAYEALGAGAWEQHEHLLRSLDLYEMAQTPLRHVMRTAGLTAAFLDEVIESVVRCNYGQGIVDVNALAGILAFKTASETMVSAARGNGHLVEQLLNVTSANVMPRATVTAVLPSDAGGKPVEVTYRVFRSVEPRDKSGDPPAEKEVTKSVAVDAVVIAAPLDRAGVSVTDDEDRCVPVETSGYQTIHVTVILANGLSPHYFQLMSSDEDPVLLLTTEEELASFLSLGIVHHVGDQRVYKILSRNALPDGLLREMFENSTRYARHTWAAVPRLKPLQAMPWVRPASRVYYPSGFQAVVPLMETAAISARNAVNLLMADRAAWWDAHRPPPAPEDEAAPDAEADGEDTHSAFEPLLSFAGHVAGSIANWTAGLLGQEPEPEVEPEPVKEETVYDVMNEYLASAARYFGVEDTAVPPAPSIEMPDEDDNWPWSLVEDSLWVSWLNSMGDQAAAPQQ